MASSPRRDPGRGPARVVFRPACTSAIPTTTSLSSPCTIAGPDVPTLWTSGAAEGAALAPGSPVSSRTKKPSTTCRAPQPLQQYRQNEKYGHACQRDQWPPCRGESRYQEIQRAGEEQHCDVELESETYLPPRRTWRPRDRDAVLVDSRVRRGEHPGRIGKDIAERPLSNTL